MLRRILSFALPCLLLGTFACNSGREATTNRDGGTPTPTTKTVSREEAIATAQRLHDELNKLEVAGDLEGQSKYFHDNVTRMDAFRPLLRGKQEWLSLQRGLRTTDVGFKVDSITTKVIDAWQEGDRLYEFGSADMAFTTAGGGGGRDPIDYFILWRVNPASNPQIEFIIWNTTQPVEQLKTFSTAATK